MRAGSTSDLVKRARRAGLGWLTYVLAAIFLVDMGGAFLPIPLFGRAGVEYNVAGGLLLLFLMFMLSTYESEKRLARLASRLTSISSGSDAVVQSLRRNFDESTSELKRRATELSGTVEDVGKGVTGFGGLVTGLEQEMTELSVRVEKIGQNVSSLRDAVSSNGKAIGKIDEAEANLARQLGAIDGRASKVETGLASLSDAVARLDSSGAKDRATLQSAVDSLSSIGGTAAGLKAGLSRLEGAGSELGEAMAALGKKSSITDGRVAGIAKSQERVARVERTTARLEVQLARLLKSEGRIGKIEKSLSKVETRLGRQAQPRRAQVRRIKKGRRRRARGVEATAEPALPVPEEVKKLEVEMGAAEESQSGSGAS